MPCFGTAWYHRVRCRAAARTPDQCLCGVLHAWRARHARRPDPRGVHHAPLPHPPPAGLPHLRLHQGRVRADESESTRSGGAAAASAASAGWRWQQWQQQRRWRRWQLQRQRQQTLAAAHGSPCFPRNPHTSLLHLDSPLLPTRRLLPRPPPAPSAPSLPGLPTSSMRPTKATSCRLTPTRWVIDLNLPPPVAAHVRQGGRGAACMVCNWLLPSWQRGSQHAPRAPAPPPPPPPPPPPLQGNLTEDAGGVMLDREALKAVKGVTVRGLQGAGGRLVHAGGQASG